MGRRRIEIVEIKDARRRKSTFQKRKSGILKKAQELAILTGSKITLKIDNEIMVSNHLFHTGGMETIPEAPPSPSDIFSTELVPLRHATPLPLSEATTDVEPDFAELVPWIPDILPVTSSSDADAQAEIDNSFNWDMVPLDPYFMPSIDDIMQYLPEDGQRLALGAPGSSEQIASLLPLMEL